MRREGSAVNRGVGVPLRRVLLRGTADGTQGATLPRSGMWIVRTFTSSPTFVREESSWTWSRRQHVGSVHRRAEGVCGSVMRLDVKQGPSLKHRMLHDTRIYTRVHMGFSRVRAERATNSLQEDVRGHAVDPG